MKIIVLLSGGLDSTVVLADHLHRGDTVAALTFDYNQTHRREIPAAQAIAEHYDIPHTILPLACFGPSALTGDIPIPEQHHAVTVVPGRNLAMLAVGAAHAAGLGYGCVAIGCNQDDADNYPDCRTVFMLAMTDAVSRACRVTIHAPLLSCTKRQIIDMAHELDVPRHLTWSCYRGGDQPCGNCGACQTLIEAECLT